MFLFVNVLEKRIVVKNQITSPISPLPSDSSVTRKISPPERTATSPNEPPIDVSFSSTF